MEKQPKPKENPAAFECDALFSLSSSFGRIGIKALEQELVTEQMSPAFYKSISPLPRRLLPINVLISPWCSCSNRKTSAPGNVQFHLKLSLGGNTGNSRFQAANTVPPVSEAGAPYVQEMEELRTGWAGGVEGAGVGGNDVASTALAFCRRLSWAVGDGEMQ